MHKVFQDEPVRIDPKLQPQLRRGRSDEEMELAKLEEFPDEWDENEDAINGRDYRE
jgi:hypothetical protein